MQLSLLPVAFPEVGLSRSFDGPCAGTSWDFRGTFVGLSWDFGGHIVDLGRPSEGNGMVLRRHRLRHRRTRRGHVVIRRKAPRLRGLELGAPAR